MIKYLGVNDHKIDLFEGQYVVKDGISYNSYLLLDEKIVITDTVDINFYHEWLENIKNNLGDKKPDYLLISHMEPDHSSSILKLLEKYKNITLILNNQAFNMLRNFYPGYEFKNILLVKDNDTLNIGKYNLKFIFAPMVHWPEVMFTYILEEKALLCADAFGRFGALDRNIDNELDEYRRYYIGIVGKYGMQVNNALKKLSSYDIKKLLPLHGPIVEGDKLNLLLNEYTKWASYSVTDGVTIVYSSVYGGTKDAALELAKLIKKDVKIFDLARSDFHDAVAYAFEYKNLVIASMTYNNGLYPHTETFLHALLERGYKNHHISIIENGTWGPQVNKIIKSFFENNLKDNVILFKSCKILSRLDERSKNELNEMAKEINND